MNITFSAFKLRLQTFLGYNRAIENPRRSKCPGCCTRVYRKIKPSRVVIQPRLRRSGHDPEQIKASIRASMRDIEKIDVDKIYREAMASVDQRQIEASIAAAEASIEKAQDDIEKLEDQFEDD